MTEQTIIKIEAIIEYIETHLNEKLSLDNRRYCRPLFQIPS